MADYNEADNQDNLLKDEQQVEDSLSEDEVAAEIVEDPFIALQRERDELEAKFLRVSADYQNYVRRSHQNVAAAGEQQLMEMARVLLNVMDHFDAALNIDPQATSTQGLLDGVQIVHNELLKTLEQFGVKPMEVAVGDEFDPMRHEALMRQATAEVEPNHVAAQLQPGYLLGDKTLRPAKVAVAEPMDEPKSD